MSRRCMQEILTQHKMADTQLGVPVKMSSTFHHHLLASVWCIDQNI